MNALVVGNGSYIVRLSVRDLHGPTVIIIAISPELVTHLLFMSRSRENFHLAKDVSLWNEICDYNNDQNVMGDAQVPGEYV